MEHGTPSEAAESPYDSSKATFDPFAGLMSSLRNHRKKIGLTLLCLCSVLMLWPVGLGGNRHVRQDRVASMNAELQGKTPQEILQWVAKTMPKGVIQFSSFGPSGMVIIDMLDQLGLLAEMPVVLIDTLHLFPESYQHVQNVTQRYPKMKLGRGRVSKGSLGAWVST
eukprot:Skav214209  [mRNA]  locus=scaffold489:227406:240020:- [translate_table: standard]